MKFELNNLPRNCSKEQVIAEIKRVDALVNKPILTQKDFDHYAKISASCVRRKFNGWKNTLISAGLAQKYSAMNISEKMRSQQGKHLTEEAVIVELKEIAIRLGKDSLTQAEVNTNSKTISASTVAYKCGSWPNGLKKAGLNISPEFRRAYSDNEYFENLLKVWTHHGRQPYSREMGEPPSSISPKAYEGHFGSWRKALEAFVVKMNSNEVTTQQETVQATPEESSPKKHICNSVKKAEDSRAIPMGLRFKILARDRFKCVRCGATPANDQKCRLHVDHIIPFSKGGRTVLENLQTKCEKCNLGKGNRHLE